MARLLVTGGAGFIGANFVRYTLEHHPEHEIVVLDALTYAGDLRNLGTSLEHIELAHGDVADEPLVDRLVARTDVVVHFAAESHNDNSFLGPLRFVTTNTVGTAVVLEAVRHHDRRLHHVSTDEVYGSLPLDDSIRFSERSPLRPTSYYSASKAAADLLVGAAVHQFGVAATVSNCSNNYGPLQHVEKFIPRQITNILDGIRPRLYGTGENIRDWIHVDDHNAAVHAILERGRLGETYLIGADGERSNLEVVRLLLELLDRDESWFELVPDRPGHDLRYAIDGTKLRSELGWRPRYESFRDGLAATVEWYREHEAWWRPAKQTTEARYAQLGR